MNITPLSTYAIPNVGQDVEINPISDRIATGQPTFLDVFTQIFTDAVDTTQRQSEDRILMMLGDVDNLEEIQLNMQKAEIATDLLVNVRNSVLDAYNEMIRMQI